MNQSILHCAMCFDKYGKKQMIRSRVLQCHEDELTQMVSTMSDGWKFEQVTLVLYQETIIYRECTWKKNQLPE